MRGWFALKDYGGRTVLPFPRVLSMLRRMPSGSPPWRQIEELYHAALECNASDRATLLAGVDPDIQREVASLLAQKIDGCALSNPELFITSALGGRDRGEGRPAALSVNTRLGPYEISAQIGVGGMG
jgi:hypothetical protein